jgi:hypothetical protein
MVAIQPALQWVSTWTGRCVRAEVAVEHHVLLGDATRFAPGSVGARRRRERRHESAHARQCPAQVDRGRARSEQRGMGCGEARVAAIGAQRQCQSVGARHADQRRTAQLHGADGIDDVSAGRQLARGQRVRQARLVDDADALAAAGADGNFPQRTPGTAVDLHGKDSTDRSLLKPRPPLPRGC